MPQPIRFGVILIQNAPWPTMAERAQHIEELGFDHLWVADHFVNWREPLTPWFDGWTLLTAFAAITSRIRVGTLVTNMPMHNPAMLARQALTVDHISGGRLEIGLGTGVNYDPSYSMIGVPNYDAPERVARFREFVEIVDGMLSYEVTTFEGRYYTVKEAAMNPRPIQQPRPPIAIAALGPAMLRIAARYADTWNSFGGRGISTEESLAIIRERNTMLDDFCAEIGRDPSEISRSILVFGPAVSTSPFASVQAFHDFVGTHREAGLNEFVFYYPPEEWYAQADADQGEVFERVAEEVIPAMR